MEEKEATPIISEVILEGKKEEPKIEKKETPPPPVYRPELDKNLSFDVRIEKFLESRNSGQFIKLNDFLKSLYPLPRPNETPAWATQSAAKQLRLVLIKMQSEGRITIQNNMHLKLGAHHYPDATTGKVAYRNLSDVIIEAKK